MTNAIYPSELQFKNYWLSIAWASLIIILIFSLIPVSVQVPANNFDKVIHVVMYIVPTGIFCGASGRRSLVWIVMGLAVFGASIEVIQYWLPWRSGEWQDAAANMVGVGIGTATAQQARLILSKIEMRFRGA